MELLLDGLDATFTGDVATQKIQMNANNGVMQAFHGGIEISETTFGNS